MFTRTSAAISDRKICCVNMALIYIGLSVHKEPTTKALSGRFLAFVQSSKVYNAFTSANNNSR